jgi:hypothetical protein
MRSIITDSPEAVPPDTGEGTQIEVVRDVSLGTLGSEEIVITVWGSDLPTDRRRTTVSDIARLLVDREIRRTQERLAKPLRATDADMLNRRRSEMLQGFSATAARETISDFQRMADIISEERLAYSVRTKAQERLAADAQKRKRNLKALRHLIGSVESDWRRPVKSFKYSPAILDQLRRFEPAPAPVLATPWHSCAVRLAVAYRVTLDRGSRLSKDGDAVRFVELALEEIGARPRSRSAIEKVLRRAFR